MARTRKKTPAESTATGTPQPPATDFAPDQQEEIVHGVADQPPVEPPADHFTSQHAPKAHAPGFIANPSSTRRESHADSVLRRLPDKLTIPAGDLKVQLIDAGRNEMGIGIRVVAPEGRTLSEEEKQIIRTHIKGEDGQQTGFSWDRDNGMWHKHILREGEHVDDVPPSRPVAIRLDAERRVQQLAEALREHSADPVGYADMVQQRREQAAESSRIPD